MAQNIIMIVPLAGLGVLGWILLRNKSKKQLKIKYGAFVDEFEILPPPLPPPPQAPPILSGYTFAVKDIFNISGRVTGFGNPDWKRTHENETVTALVIDRLIQAGATLVGVTHMDELAYSIAGQNKSYGTPTNPAAPEYIPGGSSSGSAVAVSGRLVDFSIGTDTGGSVRVPAACCGVLGFRPSHFTVPVDGVVPMAQSLDTVGCFARDGTVLRAVAHVLMGQPFSPMRAPSKILIADDLFDLSPSTKKKLMDVFLLSTEKLLGQAMQRVNVGTFLSTRLPSLSHFILPEKQATPPSSQGLVTLKGITEAFRALQGYEFAHNHSDWLSSVKPKLASDIAARVQLAKSVSEERYRLALAVKEELRAAMDEILRNDVILALPTISGLPPKVNSKQSETEAFRANSFLLLSIAGMAGCPQVSLPAGSQQGVPLAISLVTRYGSDSLLLDAALAYERQLEECALSIENRESSAMAELTPQQQKAKLAKDKGNEHYKAKRYDKAVELYTEAIQWDDSNSIYFGNRAMALLQLCHFQDAEADCTRALELDKRNVKAMLRRGTAREFLGLYKEAKLDFEHALVYEPGNKMALDALARLRESPLV